MRSRTAAAVLAFLLGGVGAHKFYLGHHIAGVVYLLFSWTFIPSIIGFFEAIGYLIMEPAEFDRRYNAQALPAPQQGWPAPPHGVSGPQHGWSAPSHTWQRPDAGSRPLGSAQLGEELRHLHELHIAGLLTDDEFAQQKARLLSRS